MDKTQGRSTSLPSSMVTGLQSGVFCNVGCNSPDGEIILENGIKFDGSIVKIQGRIPNSSGYHEVVVGIQHNKFVNVANHSKGIKLHVKEPNDVSRLNMDVQFHQENESTPCPSFSQMEIDQKTGSSLRRQSRPVERMERNMKRTDHTKEGFQKRMEIDQNAGSSLRRQSRPVERMARNMKQTDHTKEGFQKRMGIDFTNDGQKEKMKNYVDSLQLNNQETSDSEVETVTVAQNEEHIAIDPNNVRDPNGRRRRKRPTDGDGDGDVINPYPPKKIRTRSTHAGDGDGDVIYPPKKIWGLSSFGNLSKMVKRFIWNAFDRMDNVAL